MFCSVAYESEHIKKMGPRFLKLICNKSNYNNNKYHKVQQQQSNCFIRLMISKSASPRRAIIECEVIILSAVARPIYCLSPLARVVPAVVMHGKLCALFN